MRHLAVQLAATFALVLPAQTPPVGYQQPTPGFAGTFGNVLRDRLTLQLDGNQVTGSWRALFTTTALTGRLDGDRVVGTDAAQPWSAQFDGDQLVLQIGEQRARLRPLLDLDPKLAELGPRTEDPSRQWTVAIYLAADNDLEGGALDDLGEMMAGMPASGIEVVVFFDRAKGYATTTTDWTDARILRLTGNRQDPIEELTLLGEVDSGHPRTLASFLCGVRRRFPAKHHAVVLWDHGGGWGALCSDHDAPGARNGRHSLTLPDIRNALATSLVEGARLRYDLVAFDACMMGQLEVALAIADLATTMVASEAIVPGTGFPYEALLPEFAAHGDPADIGRALVAAYGTFSEANHLSSATLTALDLQAIPAVGGALETLAGEALQASREQWSPIARALYFAEGYEPREDRLADDSFSSIDLVDCSQRLRGVPGITDQAVTALQQAIGKAVLAWHRGSQRTLSRGLAIYGPHRERQFDVDYQATPLGRSGWSTLLKLVHARAAADQSELAVREAKVLGPAGATGDPVTPFGGHHLECTAVGSSLAEVRRHDLFRDAANDRWLVLRQQLVTDPFWPARWAAAAAADTIDLLMPQFQDGPNRLQSELTGLGFTITDGTLTTYGTLDMAVPSMQGPFQATARYTPKAGGPARLVQVSFDRGTWGTVAVKPIRRPGDRIAGREIEPQAGDQFAFWLQTVGNDGSRGDLFQEPLTWTTNGLYLVPEADEPGSYRAELLLRTIHGRTAVGQHDYTVVANPDLEIWNKGWQGFDPAVLPGTWDQVQIVGPGQVRDLRMVITIEATDAGTNIYRVTARGGPDGTLETRQNWYFDWTGLPCLRIVTHVADGQKFAWYGPVGFATRNGEPVLSMKSVNTAGVVWEFRKRKAR